MPQFDRRDNNDHHIDTSHSTLCRRPTSYTLFTYEIARVNSRLSPFFFSRIRSV